MVVSLKNYTNRYLSVAILLIIAVWAALFYALMMDEVYDNVDDGLKNQKIEIIRAAYNDAEIINENKDFGINQFRIYEASSVSFSDKNSFSREFIYMPYDGEDEPYRVLRTGFYTKNGTPYHLEIRTSTVEEDDYLINLGISLTVLYIVIILSIMLINHFVLTKAWRPFQIILDNLNQYRFGHTTSFERQPTAIREFQLLHDGIQVMIDKNEQVFNNQKRFIENASHELQTPLAIVFNKLEVLAEDDSLSAQQLEALVNAQRSLKRMIGLNKSLLMMSRIDNNQYSDVSLVNFNEVLRELLEDFKDYIDFKEIKLEVLDESVFELAFNSDLAYILLSNLLRNAISYNVQKGGLIVHIASHRIQLANSSSAQALNTDYIFERFYKGSQDSASNGLGLSIVKAIVEKNADLSLTYSYDDYLHYFSINK